MKRSREDEPGAPAPPPPSCTLASHALLASQVRQLEALRKLDGEVACAVRSELEEEVARLRDAAARPPPPVPVTSPSHAAPHPTALSRELERARAEAAAATTAAATASAAEAAAKSREAALERALAEADARFQAAFARQRAEFSADLARAESAAVAAAAAAAAPASDAGAAAPADERALMALREELRCVERRERVALGELRRLQALNGEMLAEKCASLQGKVRRLEAVAVDASTGAALLQRSFERAAALVEAWETRMGGGTPTPSTLSSLPHLLQPAATATSSGDDATSAAVACRTAFSTALEDALAAGHSRLSASASTLDALSKRIAVAEANAADAGTRAAAAAARADSLYSRVDAAEGKCAAAEAALSVARGAQQVAESRAASATVRLQSMESLLRSYAAEDAAVPGGGAPHPARGTNVPPPALAARAAELEKALAAALADGDALRAALAEATHPLVTSTHAARVASVQAELALARAELSLLYKHVAGRTPERPGLSATEEDAEGSELTAGLRVLHMIVNPTSSVLQERDMALAKLVATLQLEVASGRAALLDALHRDSLGQAGLPLSDCLLRLLGWRVSVARGVQDGAVTVELESRYGKPGNVLRFTVSAAGCELLDESPWLTGEDSVVDPALLQALQEDSSIPRFLAGLSLDLRAKRS